MSSGTSQQHDKIMKRWVKHVNLQQKWKDGIWLQSQVVSGRLNPLWLDYLPIFTKCLEETYPGQWDIHVVPRIVNYGPVIRYDADLRQEVVQEFMYGMYVGHQIQDYKWELTLRPVLRFDEITITNSKNQSVPIRDMFVRLNTRLEEDENEQPVIRFGTITGTRTTFTYDEYSSGYTHSHLSHQGWEVLNFRNFCTGAGEINNITAMLNSNFSEGTLKLLLFHIKGYLEWESLEGGPYRRIHDIFLRQQVGNIHILTRTEAVSIARTIINHRITQSNWNYTKKVLGEEPTHNIPLLDWKMEGSQYKLIDNEKLEAFCLYVGNEDIAKYQKEVVVYKDEQGNLYRVDSVVNYAVNQVEKFTDFVPFQNQEYRLHLYGTLDTKTGDFYISPIIKKYVKQQLEYRANNDAVRTSVHKYLETSSRNAKRISAKG